MVCLTLCLEDIISDISEFTKVELNLGLLTKLYKKVEVHVDLYPSCSIKCACPLLLTLLTLNWSLGSFDSIQS